MNKSIWLIVCMAAITAVALVMGMMVSLGQLQETPAGDWVKLAEAITSRFSLDKCSVRVDLVARPTSMHVAYLTKADTKFDTTVQNAEMESIAQFAVGNYKGRDLYMIENVMVTRSETHGSGCFQETYVAKYSYVNPRRTPPNRFGLPVTPPSPKPGEPGDQSDR